VFGPGPAHWLSTSRYSSSVHWELLLSSDGSDQTSVSVSVVMRVDPVRQVSRLCSSSEESVLVTSEVLVERFRVTLSECRLACPADLKFWASLRLIRYANVTTTSWFATIIDTAIYDALSLEIARNWKLNAQNLTLVWPIVVCMRRLGFRTPYKRM